MFSCQTRGYFTCAVNAWPGPHLRLVRQANVFQSRIRGISLATSEATKECFVVSTVAY